LGRYIYLIANNNNIIGYLVIVDSYINIAIIKIHQNIEIATAIISQFMKIYSAIFFTKKDNNPFLYIKNTEQKFILSITKKLNFTYKLKHFERRCKQ